MKDLIHSWRTREIKDWQPRSPSVAKLQHLQKGCCAAQRGGHCSMILSGSLVPFKISDILVRNLSKPVKSFLLLMCWLNHRYIFRKCQVGTIMFFTWNVALNWTVWERDSQSIILFGFLGSLFNPSNSCHKHLENFLQDSFYFVLVVFIWVPFRRNHTQTAWRGITKRLTAELSAIIKLWQLKTKMEMDGQRIVFQNYDKIFLVLTGVLAHLFQPSNLFG